MPIRPAMVLITGGAGFIGSNVAAALEQRGMGPIVICDRLGTDEKWRNVAKRELVDLVPPDHLFDLLDRESPASIVHMGAVSATTVTDADMVVDTNFRLAVRLWRWCARAGVPFIYASSAATYGDGGFGFDDDPSPEALARLRPLNVYGWSKHLFDRWVARRVRDGGERPPQWAGLKFFNVYGPNEYHKGTQASVAWHIFRQIRDGRPARLFRSHHPDYPDGGQLRDFVWVDDCVDVVLWLLETPSVSGLFNCGAGHARSFADLAHAVFTAMEVAPTIEYVPTPEAIRRKYQYHTEARLDRLRAAGYVRAFTALEDGVATYVQHYLDGADPYR